MSHDIETSVHIDATPDDVFAFINTPSECVRASPSQDFHDITDLDNGGHEYDYTFRMAGVPLTGHCTSTTCDPNERVLVYNYTGNIDAELELNVEPDGDGTLFELTTTYTVPASIFGKIARPVIERYNEREMRSFADNVKAMVEEEWEPEA